MMLCLGIFGNRRPVRFAHRPTLRPSAGLGIGMCQCPCGLFFEETFRAYGHRLSPQEALGYEAQGLRDYGTVTGWKGVTVRQIAPCYSVQSLVTFRSLLKCSVPTLFSEDAIFVRSARFRFVFLARHFDYRYITDCLLLAPTAWHAMARASWLAGRPC